MVLVHGQPAEAAHDLTRVELEKLEGVIERGRQTFVEVGLALMEIRDRRGYRAVGYPTFETYLYARWGWSRRHGYEFMEAAQVVQNVRSIAHLPEDANVDRNPTSTPVLGFTQAVQLARLSPDEQQAMALQVDFHRLTVRQLRARIRELQEAHRHARARNRAASAATDGDTSLPPTGCCLEVGDARRLRLKDESAQLVVTDPPYNADVRYDVYSDRRPWRSYWYDLIVPALEEAYRVLAPGGRLCVVLPNALRRDEGDPVPWPLLIDELVWETMPRLGYLPRERITWVKREPPAEGEDPEAKGVGSTAWGTWCSEENPVLRAAEAQPIFVFSKASYAREKRRSDLVEDEFLAWTRNLWFVPPIATDPGSHPAPFPEELARRLIKLYSYPVDLVADPFLGSGTTAVAAAQLGREFYGCDVSDTYVREATARVARAAGSVP